MRLWPRSLTGRILLAEALAILAVILVLPTITVSLLHQTMKGYQFQLLDAEARQIAVSVRRSDGMVRVHIPAALATAYATAYDGRAFAIVDQTKRILLQSNRAIRFPLDRLHLARGTTSFDLPPLIGVSFPVSTTRRPCWVVVIQDQAEPGAILDDIADAFLRRYIAILVAALMLLPIVNSVMIRRLVLAVRRVSNRAADIGPNNLDLRLDAKSVPAEVTRLVDATNDLVSRLQQSFVSQRQFTANLVHELRTPLAALKVQIDRVVDADARASLNQSVDRVSHVISQLHNLTALETLESGELRVFDLGDIARQTVIDLAQEVYAAGDSIDLSLPDQPVLVTGEPVLVGIALANLIANGSRHTPRGTVISVGVFATGIVEVADNGPGITSDKRDLVTQRFWRADQSRSDTAGLGLSIVQRIVDVHGGRFDIASESGGGARFRITLRLAKALTGPSA